MHKVNTTRNKAAADLIQGGRRGTALYRAAGVPGRVAPGRGAM